MKMIGIMIELCIRMTVTIIGAVYQDDRDYDVMFMKMTVTIIAAFMSLIHNWIIRSKAIGRKVQAQAARVGRR